MPDGFYSDRSKFLSIKGRNISPRAKFVNSHCILSGLNTLNFEGNEKHYQNLMSWFSSTFS